MRKNKLIKKPEPTIDVVLEHIKHKNYEEALEYSIEAMPKQEKIKLLMNILKKSKYKVYFLSLEKFSKIVDDYLQTEDKKEMLEYLEILQKNRGTDAFHFIRLNTLTWILNSKNRNTSYNRPHDIIIDILDLYEEKDQKWISIICDVCTINWPENKALKLLYG